MIYGLLESFNDSILLLILVVVAMACIGGGIPPMLERRRRRSIENDLPSFLESLSDSVGAGRGLQEAMMEQSQSSNSLLANLLSETLKESHASSFEASLISFAAKTRSSQVQRVMMLVETAIQQDSSLQPILSDLSRDYERLNDLMNRRETELSGRGMLIVLFVSIGLPVLIAFIVGLFAPASKGFQIGAFNQTFSYFFAAASAVGVAVSGRMMGRLKDTLWWLPLWMALSMGLYLGAVKAVGG
ncbi:MAG: type II secretion system F family protein [Candidatus Poseidonia sp.]|nr:type II secretion system F family protein [Poseidonia sp.]